MDYWNSAMFFPNTYGNNINIRFVDFEMMTALKDGSTLIIDSTNGTNRTGVKAQDLINILYDKKYSKQGEEK